jgi:diacylglycerol kinase family enzyme
MKPGTATPKGNASAAQWYDADELKWAVRHWAARIGVAVPQVHLRRMRGKWASISTAGRLTLNAELLDLPKDLGEFVIVQELGLYARMVEIRRRYETRLGKWRALMHAARLVAWHARATEVRFGGETLQSVRTYLLFVGNNQYELDLLHLGRRSCLDAGELCCVITGHCSCLQRLPSLLKEGRAQAAMDAKRSTIGR